MRSIIVSSSTSSSRTTYRGTLAGIRPSIAQIVPCARNGLRRCKQSAIVERQRDHLALRVGLGDLDDAPWRGVGAADIGQRDRAEARRDDRACEVAGLFAGDGQLTRRCDGPAQAQAAQL